MATKRCNRCGEAKDESEFNRRGSGRQGRCRSCNSEYLKQHYRENPDYYKAKARAMRKRMLVANQTRVRDYFASHPCVDCGESDPVVLQFDHVRGEKTHNVGVLVRSTLDWSRIQAEINKCDVRCSNCHWRRTAKQFNWYAYLDSE